MKDYICPCCGVTFTTDGNTDMICKICGEYNSFSRIRNLKLSEDAIMRANAALLVERTVENKYSVPYDLIQSVVDRVGQEENCDSLFDKLDKADLTKVSNMIGDNYYEKGNFKKAYQYYSLPSEDADEEFVFRYYSSQFYSGSYSIKAIYEILSIYETFSDLMNNTTDRKFQNKCTAVIKDVDAAVQRVRERIKYEEEMSKAQNTYYPSMSDLSLNSYSSSNSSSISDDDAWFAIATGMMSCDTTGL